MFASPSPINNKYWTKFVEGVYINITCESINATNQ